MKVKDQLVGFWNNQLEKKFLSPMILFILFGIASAIWFLVRVVPKPSRASYPCVRAAAPIASAFVLYLLSLGSSVFLFRKAAKYLSSSRAPLATLFLLLGFAASIWSLVNNSPEVSASVTPLEGANQPIGEARGIFPGRVVWVYNPEATNSECTNTYGDGYFMDSNTDQDEVDRMLEEALMELTGQNTVASAWDEAFKYHNQTRGKGGIGYNSNEIIFIKINATSTWSENINSSFERLDNGNYAISETSPQVVLAVLRQLVNIAGVPQGKIYVGDPMKHIYQDNFTKWHNEFPDVHYLDNSSSSLGREKAIGSATALIKYSDRGTVLREGSWENSKVGDPVYVDELYSIFENMEYMINIPTLKGHKYAGVTMFGKNHFGSVTRSNAKHLHGGLVRPSPNENLRNTYGLYRVQVDLMSHRLLGKKNLIYLMDALYCSGMEITKPSKWQIAPFDNDWTSSIFLSHDVVAIESVGFDFLYAQYNGSGGNSSYPHLGAVDDYLHQLADSAQWPEGITYDPENDGASIDYSQGVHEHWNNADDKRYSRNLGTGEGIELIEKFISVPTDIIRVTRGISATSDDVEEFETGGTIFMNSTDLELVFDGARGNQHIGLLFRGLDIPQGAAINSAYIQFTVDEAGSAPTSLVFRAHDTDDAPGFGTSPYDLSGRAFTSSSVSWSPPAWGTEGMAGAGQRTPDLSSIVQEVVSRPGWGRSSNLAIVVYGSGRRTAESYDGVPGSAPKLFVEYRLGGGPPDAPPSISITHPADGAVYNAPTSVTINASATDTDGTVTEVEFFVDGSSIGNDNTSPYSINWAIPANGSYQLTARATDNGQNTALSGPVNIIVGDALVATSSQIGATSDDVEEFETDGTIFMNSTDLELVLDGQRGNQHIGLMFRGLDIPQGAAINSAYIQFTVDEAGSAPTSLVIQAHNTGSAPDFGTLPYNVSGRSLTSSSVSWSPPAWGTEGMAGAGQRTPDISEVIQEVVNRPGWGRSSNLAIVVNGSGRRTAESYDGVPGSAPKLFVEYRLGGGPPDAPPSISITHPADGAVYNAPTGITIEASATDSDGTVTEVEFFVDGSSIGKDNTSPYSINWAIPANGSYRVTARATDNGQNTALSVPVNIIVGDALVATSSQIGATNDDVEEFETEGTMFMNSSDLELVLDGQRGNQHIGLMFRGLDIPQGAAINSAYIQFTVDEAGSAPTSLVIQAHNTGSAPDFGTSPYNVSGRSLTSSSVSWSPPAWGTEGMAGAGQRTPDISEVIQEVVNRPGWGRSSNLAIVVYGSGRRTAESYDGVPGSAPKLFVEYRLGGGPPDIPLSNGITHQADSVGYNVLTDITVETTGINAEGAATDAVFLIYGSSIRSDIGGH